MKKNNIIIVFAIAFIILQSRAFAASEFQQKNLINRYVTAGEQYWKDITKANGKLIDDNLLRLINRQYDYMMKYANDVDKKKNKKRFIPEATYIFANLSDYISRHLGKKGGRRFQLAKEYERDGVFNLSADICNNILMTEPKNLKAATLQAELFFKMGMYLEAMQTYKKVLKMDKNNQEALYRLGALYIRLSNYNEAAKLYKRLLKINPNHPKAKKFVDLYEGRVSSSNNKKQKRKIKVGAMQHFIIAEKLFNGGKYKGAAEEYSRAIEKDPHFYKAYIFLGECLTRLRQYKNSQHILKQAAILSPKDPEAYHYLGLSLEKEYNFNKNLKLLKKAVDNYEKALKVSPSYSSVNKDLNRAKGRLEGK